jgi:hypothetical protein
VGVWSGLGPRGFGMGAGLGPLRASSGVSYGEMGQFLAFLVRFILVVCAVVVGAIVLLFFAAGRGLIGLAYMVGGAYLIGRVFGAVEEYANSQKYDMWDFLLRECLPLAGVWFGLLMFAVLIRLVRYHISVPLLRLGPRVIASMQDG